MVNPNVVDGVIFERYGPYKRFPRSITKGGNSGGVGTRAPLLTIS